MERHDFLANEDEIVSSSTTCHAIIYIKLARGVWPVLLRRGAMRPHLINLEGKACKLSTKTAKVLLLENFPLYGMCKCCKA